MMSLFSSFDSHMFNKQFIIMILILLWVNNCTYFMSMNKNMMSLASGYLFEFFTSIKKDSPKMVYHTFIFLSILIFWLNFSSVMSFNFAFTSQVSMVLSVSLIFWSSFTLISLVNNFKMFLAHMVPNGTPLVLVWFLFIIEMVSNFIRFITLTVRLTANILSGHLLMVLLSKLAMHSTLISVIFMGLNMVELMVSIIQSYIFCTMLVLYFSEVE